MRRDGGEVAEEISDRGVGDKRTAATAFQVVERVDLTGHFQFIPVHGIVPAFDVNTPGEAAPAQFRDDVRPIAVPEPGGAVLHKGRCQLHRKLRVRIGVDRGVDAVFPYHVPVYGRVFSVDMKNFRQPGFQLGHGVDQTDHLVTGLPLQSQIREGHRIEHEFPGEGVVSDVPIPRLPGSAHVAVFKGDFQSLFPGAFRKRQKDLPEAVAAFMNGFSAQTSGKPAEDIAVKQGGGLNQFSPALPGCFRHVVVFQGVSKHPQTGDHGPGFGEDRLEFLRQADEVAVPQGLTEGQGIGLEAVLLNLADIGGGFLAGAHHCANTDGFLFHGHDLSPFFVRIRTVSFFSSERKAASRTRCTSQPRLKSGQTLSQKAKQLVQTRLRDPACNVAVLAGELGVTPNYLSSRFHAETGIRLSRYLLQERLEHARDLLRDTKLKVVEIASASGFADASPLIAHFKRTTGLTPKRYREMNGNSPP